MARPLATPTLAIGLALVLLAGCSSAPAASETGNDDGAAEVAMKNMAFSPKVLTVKVGESVTWINQEATTHTVSADDPNQWGTPGSGDNNADWMKKGESWSHTFTEPGTYHYYCKPHAGGSMGARQGMVGTIIVEA